jgi:hypothetical protein
MANGHAKLQLEEGVSYYFEFVVTNSKMLEKDKKLLKDIPEDEIMQFVGFEISIPLTREHRTLFETALKIEQHPEERISEELKIFLRARNVLDEEFKKAIEEIKSMQL